MWHRTSVLGLVVIVALVLLVPAALSQTPGPVGAGEICSSTAPCVDPPGQPGKLRLGSMSAEASALDGATVALQQPVNSGFGLAWVVMGLLILALLYALVAAVMAAMGREVSLPAARLGILIPALAVLGLGVALYLTYVETQNVAAFCGPVGDCNAVQASPFAKLFGFLPVGLLGALGYVAILVAWFVGQRSEGMLGRLAQLAIFGMALFGVLFSVYLTYLELYIIKAVCIWCLTSAVIMSLVLAISVGPSVEALQAE